MKKALTILLVLATLLALGGFAGCAPKETEKPEATATQVSTATPTVAPTVTPTAALSPDETAAMPGTTLSSTPVRTPKATAPAELVTPTAPPSMTQLPRPASVLTEVPVGSDVRAVIEWNALNLRALVQMSTYVFSGRVVAAKEYTYSWIDKNEQEWGPFPAAILEVKIEKTYHCASQILSDTIKIFCPISLAWTYEIAFTPQVGCNYIFLTQVLDEPFYESRASESSIELPTFHEYADVYMSNNWAMLHPVVDGHVLVNKRIFSHDETVMAQAVPPADVNVSSLKSAEPLLNGAAIAIDVQNFEAAFIKLFDPNSILPEVVSW